VANHERPRQRYRHAAGETARAGFVGGGERSRQRCNVGVQHSVAAVGERELGKLAALGGVVQFPARVKCASLCWHTLHAALADAKAPVSTE